MIPLEGLYSSISVDFWCKNGGQIASKVCQISISIPKRSFSIWRHNPLWILMILNVYCFKMGHQRKPKSVPKLDPKGNASGKRFLWYCGGFCPPEWDPTSVKKLFKNGSKKGAPKKRLVEASGGVLGASWELGGAASACVRGAVAESQGPLLRIP